MTAYATRRDVYKYGLARAALSNPGRLVASALASTDTLELVEHGFETDDPVTLRAAEGGALPAPLVAGTVYYAIRVTDSTFKLASVPSGSAINLTTDGTNVIVSADLPYDDVLEFYSRFADGFLPAHLVPLTSPYPVIVVGIVAQLAAKKLQILSGQVSETMKDAEIAAKAQLERWSAGVPLRDANATAPANLAQNVSGSDPRGWAKNGSGFIP